MARENRGGPSGVARCEVFEVLESGFFRHFHGKNSRPRSRHAGSRTHGSDETPDVGVALYDNRVKVIVPEKAGPVGLDVGSERLNGHRGRIALEFRVTENPGRGRGNRRHRKRNTRRGHRNGRENFTDTPGKGGLSEHKEGDVSAERYGNGYEFIAREPQGKEAVKRDKR